MRIAWLAGLLVACAEPRTTRCGDLVCPVGKTCDDHRLTCILPSQREACEGLDAGAACTYPGELAGACDHGVCHPIVCGDGLRQLDEACDDSNTVDGDGCSADCRSDEHCGNTVVDVAAGEECDDGGFASHDGCSSACRVEVVSWAELAYPNVLRGTEHAMVYDAARDRIVRFGGLNPTREVLGETFEWSGEDRVWERISLPGPPARSEHVMVYDAHRRRTIVFGGGDDTTRFGDTWSYDGAAWTKLAIASAPSARRGAAAAYDAARDRIVLFGGDTATGLAGDTWELDGDQWIERAPAVSPPARSGHHLAYDASRQRVVLFGGEAPGELSDTWEWDGSTWQQVTTAVTAPTARGAMAYDADRAAVVLFGGTGTTPRSETWEFRGVDWVRAMPAAEPPPRVGTGMAYDALRHRLVISSGGPAVLGADYDDQWAYDGTTWTSVARVEAPPPRNSAGFVWDPRVGQQVLFGGFTPPGVLHDDTWTFDGAQWVQRAPRGAPTGTQCPMGPCPAAGMVWDSARQRIVYVREPAAPGPLETWQLVGDQWTQLATTAAPPPRRVAAMAYDPVRDRVVLFGGEGAQATPLDDTWEYDGTTWTQVTTPTAPSARIETAMTWDAALQRIVLFGGQTAAGAADDTWEYDGTWTRATPLEHPPARGGVGMSYQPRRGTVVVFGGESGPTPSTQAWEYDGTTWKLLDVARGPMPRKSPHFAWSPVLAGIVLAGGDPRSDTWELQWRSSTPDERCDDGADQDGDGLVDCADPDCDDNTCAPGRRCQAQACTCAGGGTSEQVCDDGIDDDCDGLVDCADADCADQAPCTAEVACDDGTDDDGDRRTDCTDPGCTGVLACEATETSCDDGADNDGDGREDCRDPDCFLVACPAVLP